MEKEFTDFTKLLKSALSLQEALKTLRLKKLPASGVENYNLLKSVEQMSIFQDFVRWYNNKEVVPRLKAMQKMMDFYQNKKIYVLKLGFTLPKLANIFLPKSTNKKNLPFH